VADVEFISFRKLYPEFLYPGGKDKDESIYDLESKCRRKNLLHGYNPLTWIKVGLGSTGDVIHMQWWSYVLFPAYFTILTLLKTKQKRILITVHNVTPHENATVGRLTTGILLNFADVIVVHSEANRRTLLEKYRIAQRKRVLVIPHGVLSAPKTSLTPKEARSVLGIDVDRKVVLFFGNIRPYKGLKTLLIAMKDVLVNVPGAILVIAGQPWKDWKEYEKLIRDLGLSSNVILKTGFVDMKDVPVLFLSADLVVLPYSGFDAQSGVGLLAINYGRPLIVTRVGGLDELVENPISIVEPMAPGMLADNIATILANQDLLTRLSESSRRLARKFRWSNIADMSVTAYRSLMEAE